MSNLFVFDTGLTEVQTDDPQLNEIYMGLRASSTYTQDSITGFPTYSTDSADKIYKDYYPQWLVASEPVAVGQILNVYYSGAPQVRLATASNKDRFANSVALAISEDKKVLCAVRAAVTRPQSGNWLSVVPGQTTSSPSASAEIVQKLGESAGGFFYFNFHPPVLIKPENYSYLARSN